MNRLPIYEKFGRALYQRLNMHQPDHLWAEVMGEDDHDLSNTFCPTHEPELCGALFALEMAATPGAVADWSMTPRDVGVALIIALAFFDAISLPEPDETQDWPSVDEVAWRLIGSLSPGDDIIARLDCTT